MQDDLGDRMKVFENIESKRRLMPGLPILARIDGRGFSKFTKGLQRPYDIGMTRLMIETARYLAQKTNANSAYTQSDELTLVWQDETKCSFNGKILKITSMLSAMASVYFNRHMVDYLPRKQQQKMPTFDCRIWNVPNLDEMANCFVWRQKDATKNAISMAARACFSHKELNEKSCKEMKEMMLSKGVNFDNYPNFFRKGTYIIKKKSFKKFTQEEIEKLPEKHAARQDPDTCFQRTEYVEYEKVADLSFESLKKVLINGLNI